jgi:diguanylate cyclase (GGDEF)-like protein
MSGEAKTCDSSELSRVLEQLPEGVLVLDQDGIVRFVNKIAARLVKMKMKTAVGSTFAHAVEDGTMRDFDVEMTVKDISWSGEPARLVHLKSLKSSGAFHLEWKLEAATERAREAEEEVAKLREQLDSVPTVAAAGNISQDRVRYYDEKISELESLLELAEQRSDELQDSITRDDHQQATDLQNAIGAARDAEERVRQMEEEVLDNRERVRIAEEQAEVAEERAYGLEAELEQLLADREDQEAGNDESDDQVDDRAERIESLQRQVSQLAQELVQVKSQNSTMEAQLAESHVSDSPQLQIELLELRTRLEQAEADCTISMERAEQLERELIVAKEDASSESEMLAQAARQEVSAELEAVQNSRTELEEQLAQANAARTELSEKLARLEDEWSGGLAAKEAELAEALEQLATLQETLNEAGEIGEKAHQLELDLKAREDDLNRKDSELEELREQLGLASEESEELAEQLRLEQEQFEERESELQGQVEQLQSDLEAAEGERDSILLELEDSARSAEERSVEAKELEEKVVKLEATTSEIEALKKETRRLEALLESAEELAQKGEKADRLERKLEGALRRAEEAEERLIEERRLLNEMKNRAEKLSSENREMSVPAMTADAISPETERLAFQDVLTGLPNRNIIQRYLGFMLKQSSRYSRLTAMFRVDCDNFKTISDTFGVEVGDELIRAVGERLSAVVRGSDVLGRYGEDEFIMLLSEMADQDEASVITAAVIKRLYQRMKQPFQVGDQTITLSVSVGVSIYPLDAQNGEQMFEHASVALRRAKETGRGQAQYFTPDLQSAHVARSEIDQELKVGLEKKQFEVLFQPIFDLTNGQIVGVESLTRWRHPTRGLLGPDDFLQVAEDSGIIVLIGNWALRRAVEEAAQWHQSGMGVFVSVNLSRRQLLQADLLPTIQAALAEVRCSPERLLLEIPEALTGEEFPKVRETLNNLQRIGVRLAVDNFGTASSSLQGLRRGPFQVLKVDRKFVRGVPQNEENTGIVLSALTVGHHLGRVAIAVGVETEQEKTWLAQTGCRFAQGDFLSEPLTAAQMSEFARRS